MQRQWGNIYAQLNQVKGGNKFSIHSAHLARQWEKMQMTLKPNANVHSQVCVCVCVDNG